jgi:Fic family protein
MPGDNPLAGVWLASQARGFLENLAGKGHIRYMSRSDIERWLADILSGTDGESRLNALRDAARGLVARERAWTDAFARLDGLIGAALSSQPAEILQTETLRSHAAGAAVDHARLDRFGQLVDMLDREAPAPQPILLQDAQRRQLLPFYEAYFSNFIEGTEFTLDEAAAIVFQDEVPANRPADAHDVVGTYRIVADAFEMARIPRDAGELVTILKARHAQLMEARPEKRPGQFKVLPNRAGSTVFVAPELVEATLRAGFALGQALRDPFARAVFMMFLVSEVHPFDDGNGRVARMMMNAELSHSAEVRIIIPTVYRNSYLQALKAATNNGTFASLTATLRFAQRWTAMIDFTSRETAEADLVRTNALRDSNEADAVGVRLRLPD